MEITRSKNGDGDMSGIKANPHFDLRLSHANGDRRVPISASCLGTCFAAGKRAFCFPPIIKLLV